jgi:N-acetylglucosamine kinase-like BadF-type ATPase
MIYLGIDGGGSNLRAVLTTSDLTPLAEWQVARTSNPSSIGREAAAQLLQEAVSGVLFQAGVSPDAATAVGIGVAGADAAHSADWLAEVLRPVLPTAYLALSNDIEIALVGANGARLGMMLLAGTGSALYAINAAGDSRMFGGWGYLIGDDGGGYWMGREAIRHITDADDQHEAAAFADQPLVKHIFAATEVKTARDLIPWLYGVQPPRIRDVAALTSAIFAAHAEGDFTAQAIVQEAAQALYGYVCMAERRLTLSRETLAFGGGLLQSETPLQSAVCDLLGLSAPPAPKYPAVMGAALLAKLSFEAKGEA